MADLYETIASSEFQSKCKAAFQEAAVAISAETTGDDLAARKVMCGKVLWGEMQWEEMAFAVATHSTSKPKIVADEDYDGSIYGVVAGLFTPFAVSLAALA